MIEDPEHLQATLSSRQKKTLRGLGHHLEPMVYVGREGISPPLIASTQASLKAHELIKVKLGQNCPLSRQDAATELVRRTGALLVQVIGRMVLLYLANPRLDQEKRIQF